MPMSSGYAAERHDAPPHRAESTANDDVGSDELAVLCSEKGLLLAPGRLFSPHGTPSEWMRVNVATDPELTAVCIRSARSLAARRRALS